MNRDENSEPKHIKCVNFDLSTEKLLKHFLNGTAKPYELIKQFFLDKGFEHRQYSGYISKEPLDETAISLIIEELGKTFTWLKDCMQEFDVSNAPEKVSVKEQIIYSATKEEQRQKEAKFALKNTAKQDRDIER